MTIIEKIETDVPFQLPKIKTRQYWSADHVRSACIRNDLYTRGDNCAYSRMLEYVSLNRPNAKTIYIVADDSATHSKNQTIANVMYILANEAIVTTFEADGEDDF